MVSVHPHKEESHEALGWNAAEPVRRRTPKKKKHLDWSPMCVMRDFNLRLCIQMQHKHKHMQHKHDLSNRGHFFWAEAAIFFFSCSVAVVVLAFLCVLSYLNIETSALLIWATLLKAQAFQWIFTGGCTVRQRSQCCALRLRLPQMEFDVGTIWLVQGNQNKTNF